MEMELFSDDECEVGCFRVTVHFNSVSSGRVRSTDIEGALFHNAPRKFEYQGVTMNIRFSAVRAINNETTRVTFLVILNKRNRSFESKVKDYIENNPDVIFKLFERTTFYFDGH